MKRVFLSVDLDENELFEDSVKKQLEGYAKQIAREQYMEVIKDEVERVAKKAEDDFKNGYGHTWYLSETKERVRNKVKGALDNYRVTHDDIMIEIRNSITETIMSMVAPQMDALAKAIREDNAAVIGKLIETMVGNKQ